MKLIKPLTLIASLVISASTFANLANSMSVEFPKGSDHATLTGVVNGHDYDAYYFWAKKGQLLSIQAHDSDPQIQTALFFKGKANSTSGISQILPYSGEYELRIMKNHADAMNNTARQYNLVLKIQNAKQAQTQNYHHNQHPTQNWITYLCDDQGKMKVQYSNLKGKNPAATVNYRGQNYNLTYDRRYSKNDLMAFTSKNYTLSVDHSQTKDPHQALVYSFSKLKNGNDQIVLQNCQPQ